MIKDNQSKMPWRCLIRDDRGISAVEFALVCAVFFLLVFGIIDFSRAMWEWNAAARATQAGVHHAVVSDIVSLDYKTFSALVPPLNLKSGNNVPIQSGGIDVIKTIYCSDNDLGVGINIGCGTSLGGLDSGLADADAFLAIVAMMQRYDDRIEAHNVVIEYRHIGLGFAGNPIASDIDPLVTVKLRDMVLDFITPGLSGIFTIDIPDFAASLTGEDHVTI